MRIMATLLSAGVVLCFSLLASSAGAEDVAAAGAPSPQEIQGILAPIDEKDADLAAFMNALGRENDEGAAQLARRLLHRYPHSLPAWRLLLRALHARGARDALDEALASAPGPSHPAGAICFAKAYWEYLDKRYASSATLLRSCHPVVRGHVLARNLQAAITGELGDRGAAIQQLRQILSTHPKDELAGSNLRRQVGMLVGSETATTLSLPPSRRRQAWARLAQRIKHWQSEFKPAALRVEVTRGPDASGMRAFAALFVSTQDSGEAHLFVEGEADPALSFVTRRAGWLQVELDRRFAPHMNLLVYNVSTGSHHFHSTVLAVPRSGRPALAEWEWQNESPLIAVDLDADGVPELLEDRTDHYVHSYAAGIANYNLHVLRYDAASGSFRRQLLGIPDGPVSPAAQRELADGLEHAARGRWGLAAESFRRASNAAPGSETMHWNLRIAKVHASRFQAQFKRTPGTITALLAGDVEVLTRQVDAMDGMVSNAVPVVNLLQMGLDYPQTIPFISWQLYARGRSANGLAGGGSPFPQQDPKSHVIVPEARAYEHAVLALRRGALFYAEPEQEASRYMRWLDAGNSASEYVFAQQAAMRPTISRHFSSGSYTQVDDPERALGNAFHLEDFGQADRLVQQLLRDNKSGLDPAFLRYMNRRVGIKLGRNHAVLAEIESLPGVTPDELEVYERLGLQAVAMVHYKKQAARCGDEPERGHSRFCATAHLALGRVLLSRGEATAALESLARAEALARRHDPWLYDYEHYPELLTLRSRALMQIGQLELARASNALAHFALVRSTDPGAFWIQSSFYYRHPALARLLLTDFELARAARKERLATAYLSAALSIVRDLSLAAVEEASRFHVAQTEQEILRAAAQFLCETGRGMDALVAINQLRDISATRLALRSVTAAGGRPPAPVTTAVVENKIKQLVAEGRAVIQFVVTGRAVFALVANPDVRIVKLSVSPQTLRERTNVLSEALAGLDASERTAEARALLASLHSDLLHPLEAHLGSARGLLIIPDDSLHRLPFAALLDASGKHLVQRFEIAYASSIQAMSMGRRLPPTLREALVAHSPTTAAHPALLSGPAELAAVRLGLPHTKVHELHGAGLDRSSMRRVAPHADLIHLGTHAFVDTTAPQRSYIMLNETSPTAGDLRVEHLLSGEIRFSGQPIVVLAACASGSGQVFQDGLLGFGYGLTAAGASAAVMTFWEIEDQAALRFSQVFYQALGSQVDPMLALAKAQRESIGRMPMGAWASFFVQRAY
jgi:CHAT domain-containing protein